MFEKPDMAIFYQYKCISGQKLANRQPSAPTRIEWNPLFAIVAIQFVFYF